MLILRRVLLVLVVIVMLLLGTCIFVWTTEDVLPSPDGNSRILVQTRSCVVVDCILAVKLHSGWRTITIAQREDCAVGFAYAKWFDNVVAVHVDGVYCGALNAAYDLSTNQPVDYKKYESRLIRAIVEAYGASPGTPELQEQYYRRKKRH